jgi:outer membrane protein TolC
MMLRYGAMQVDVFTLLLEAQQKLNANAAAADALRDFWLASIDLSTAMAGGGTDPGESSSIASPNRPGAAAH